MSFLITPSLLSSWLWLVNALEDFQESALEDFTKTLHREPIEDNEAMREGRRFEEAVYGVCDGHKSSEFDDEEDYKSCLIEASTYVKGAIRQLKASKALTVCGQEFLVYGRLDALIKGWIVDLKFSKTFEAGKYFNSPQTSIYLFLVDDAIGFRYVISDGDKVYLDEYRKESVESPYYLIADFWQWMAYRKDLMGIYQSLWISKE